jgi:hypothetical protein
LTVRGYSFFGDSYVYVIFEDGTDLYWARSRVLEYLNQVAASLPEGATSSLGPDATGVGWVFQYALVDRTGGHDLAELRSLQDWFLKYELQTVHGVSEVATIGGMVRQYQVVVDPDKLRAFGVTLARLKQAIRDGPRATCRVSKISPPYRLASTTRVRPSSCPTWPRFESARKCDAVLLTLMVRARSLARLSSCAGARTLRRPSMPSKRGSLSSRRACRKVSRSSRPTIVRT